MCDMNILFCRDQIKGVSAYSFPRELVAGNWLSDIHDRSAAAENPDWSVPDWLSSRKIIRGCLSKNQYRLASFTVVFPADRWTDLQPWGHKFNRLCVFFSLCVTWQRKVLNSKHFPRHCWQWYKSCDMNLMFLCFPAAPPYFCRHLQRTARSLRICPHTFYSGWSQTVSEPASRWLIVKQMKATGCMGKKWEEGLLEQIIKDSACT